MKILYVTTVGSTMGFFKSFIRMLLDGGHTVDIATNDKAVPVQAYYREWGCNVYQISCTRSPLNKGSVSAIQEIKKIVTENGYDIVHCHTPIAAMCTRLACKDLRKKGVRVIYTAHGFHFYAGAPKKNWLIYYPVEKVCAKHTDTLITINQEDYAFAKEKMNAKEIVYIPGVGIDVDRFANITVDRNEKRAALGIPEDAYLLLSVGELNKNKNHEVVIRALAEIGDEKMHYAIAGAGGLKDELENLAKELGVEKRVHLLGYRTDVAELYHVSDIFVFPSFREGLSVSVMESLASGLPVICSKIRGNVDLVENGVTGYWANPFDYKTFVEGILKIQNDGQMKDKCNEASKQYNVNEINKLIASVYHI